MVDKAHGIDLAGLDKPLDRSVLQKRKGRGGKSFDFLPGHVAIRQANRLLGYDAWGYEVVSGPSLITEGKQAAYVATVRVTITGIPPREDVGFCVCEGKKDAPLTIHDHETAYKGAVTDGLKRGLRSLGAQFGNEIAAAAGKGNGQPQRDGNNGQPQPQRNGNTGQRTAQRPVQAPQRPTQRNAQRPTPRTERQPQRTAQRPVQAPQRPTRQTFGE